MLINTGNAESRRHILVLSTDIRVIDSRASGNSIVSVDARRKSYRINKAEKSDDECNHDSFFEKNLSRELSPSPFAPDKPATV